MNDEKTKAAENEQKENDEREIILINKETVQSKIYAIRGHKVMLDMDLARIYGYETKNFNRQVKNNKEKFDGDDFMFQLTKDEWENLRCKNFTSSWGGSRYLPLAFTEQGIYMLMTVLRGDLATRQSRALIRTFKQMKDYITENQGLLSQRDYLQLSLSVAEHGRDIQQIKASLSIIDHEVEKMAERLEDTVTKSELSDFMNMFCKSEYQREYILWNGQPFEADLAFSEIYRMAERKLYVIDNYIGLKTLALLKNSKENVEIILFSDNVGNGLHSTEFSDFCGQYNKCNIKLKQTGKKYHDRYIVIDYDTEQEKIFHCGPSVKDGGRRIGSIVEIREREVYRAIVDELLKMPELQLKK